MEEPTRQSLRRPQWLPPLVELWGAMEKETRYYYWRSGIKRCLQGQDKSTLKQLMEEVVANVVATKLPLLQKNICSLRGSWEVTAVAMQLSKDLALIFDATLEELEMDYLNTPAEEADMLGSGFDIATTSAQWFLKVMGALTRATIDSGSSSALPRYLGCSAGTSGRRSMEDILAPLLGLLQLSSTSLPEPRNAIMLGTSQLQGPFQPISENPDIEEPADETSGLSETTPIQPPPRRRRVGVSEDAGPEPKRMKRFHQSNKFPLKCLIEGCELEWKVKGRNSFIEHIEAHTQPYLCSVSQQCNQTFSRISNLNRHRETQHGSLIARKQKLRTEDVIEAGEIHHRIRRFESLTQLRRLLEALGFTCCDS